MVRRSEPTPESCPLTSTTWAVAHACVYTHTQIIIIMIINILMLKRSVELSGHDNEETDPRMGQELGMVYNSST